MDSEKSAQINLMDKIRIVVEFNQLSDDKKQAYLLNKGIDQSTFDEYQKEAASVIGLGAAEPVKKSRCQELIEQLRSSNEDHRRTAAKELGRMRGAQSISAIKPLIERMLHDDDDFVRNWASWSLTRIEPKHPEVVEAFLHIIEKEEESKVLLAWSLVGISPSKTDYVKNRLLEILNTGRLSAQVSAIDAIYRIGFNCSQCFAAMKEASNSENESLRRKASDVLSQIES